MVSEYYYFINEYSNVVRTTTEAGQARTQKVQASNARAHNRPLLFPGGAWRLAL